MLTNFLIILRIAYFQVINVAVCDDSFHCAVASNEGRVYIYNLCTQELLDQFDTHQDILTDMRLSTDETFIITAAKVSLNSKALPLSLQ